MKTRPMTQGRKRQRKEPEEGDIFAEEWNIKDKEIADGQRNTTLTTYLPGSQNRSSGADSNWALTTWNISSERDLPQYADMQETSYAKGWLRR